MLTVDNAYPAGPGVQLRSAVIDTRIGQSNANPGGRVDIYGASQSANGGSLGIDFDNTTITSSTGSITLTGRFGTENTRTDGTRLVDSVLQTTSGAISVTGVGLEGFDRELGFSRASGVSLGGTQVSSATGTIDVRGGVETPNPAANVGSVGVYVGDSGSPFYGSFLRSAAAVSIDGSVGGNGIGVHVTNNTFSAGAGNVAGSNVTIRAGTGGAISSDALRLDGTVNATGVVNVRPGGVNIAGTPVDRNDLAVTLGNGSYAGLAIDSSELNRISGSTVVLGSDLYANTIAVDAYGSGSFTSNSNLTLQTGAGGAIGIGAPLGVAAGKTLALASGGAVTQTGSAPITADNLLVRAGNAALLDPANSIGVLAANTGTGALAVLDSRALTLGPVPATGTAAATNSALALDATSLTGGTMLARTSAGNMTLAGNIVAGTLDLVTPGVFDNSAGSTITASDRWHLWAKTWIGEARGGLAGEGTLPNVYGCAFAGPCVVAPVATANTFVYEDRPVLSLTVNDKTRVYGDPNPAFDVRQTGLINGDTVANIVSGTPRTPVDASTSGPPETWAVRQYVISGATLTANAGYILASPVVDGTLTVARRPLQIAANDEARVYGDPNPLFTGTVTNLPSFATAASLGIGFSSSAGLTADVANYAITPVLNNPGALTNYAVAPLVNGTLTVTPRPLLIAADNKTRAYGDPNPPLTGSVSGLPSFATPASLGLDFSSVGPMVDVGNYAITPVLNNPGALANYALAPPANGTLTVTPRPLLIAADNKTRAYGDPNPLFTGSVSGLAPFATAASLGLDFVSTGSTANVGNYPITPMLNTGAVSNYAVTVTPGVLVVTPAPWRPGIDQVTYLYDRNRGEPQVCVPDSPLVADGSEQKDSGRDLLAVEWSRLRSRPNVSNCFSTGRKNGCADF